MKSRFKIVVPYCANPSAPPSWVVSFPNLWEVQHLMKPFCSIGGAPKNDESPSSWPKTRARYRRATNPLERKGTKNLDRGKEPRLKEKDG